MLDLEDGGGILAGNTFELIARVDRVIPRAVRKEELGIGLILETIPATRHDFVSGNVELGIGKVQCLDFGTCVAVRQDVLDDALVLVESNRLRYRLARTRILDRKHGRNSRSRRARRSD